MVARNGTTTMAGRNFARCLFVPIVCLSNEGSSRSLPSSRHLRTLENMSQHLMAQMQKEMTELKELGRKLSHSDGTEAPAATGGGGGDEDGSSEEAALRLVSAMGAQLGAAKDRLLGQRAALLALLSSCRGGPTPPPSAQSRGSVCGLSDFTPCHSQ